MSLLVEYTVNEGKADAQVEALNTFVAGLKAIGDEGYNYTAYETDDPTKIPARRAVAADAPKQRCLDTTSCNA